MGEAVLRRDEAIGGVGLYGGVGLHGGVGGGGVVHLSRENTYPKENERAVRKYQDVNF